MAPTTRRIPPPPPQDDDRRVFAVGQRVSAERTFYPGCPPGGKAVKFGAKGTVAAKPVMRDDPPFDPKRMIGVRWDDGRTGEVVDRLLTLEVGAER